MVVRRCKGFTLIELLVVIAIIGILAAMLFPVFARARESARKTQCLSNVKNIAMAVQMYLSDYDRFWPSGMYHDAAGQAYFDSLNGGNTCWKFNSANPFVRVPVILDEYIKNRDVWRCPSEHAVVPAAWIVPDYGPGPWWWYLRDNRDKWGNGQTSPCAGGPCCVAFPTGWGGDVTDSILQRRVPDANTPGVFDSSIGVSGSLADVSTSQMLDPAWLVVTADSMHWANFNGIDDTLYWVCRTNSCACGDWSSGQNCVLPADDLNRWNTDPGFRSQFTRHMGGSNYGFADGHAKWFMADAITSQTPYCVCCDPSTNALKWYNTDGKVRGLCPASISQTF